MPSRIKHPMLERSHQGSADPEIYERGTTVAIITGGTAKLIERLVREASEACGQKMDWNYIGGRAVVRVLGDTELAKDALARFELKISFNW